MPSILLSALTESDIRQFLIHSRDHFTMSSSMEIAKGTMFDDMKEARLVARIWLLEDFTEWNSYRGLARERYEVGAVSAEMPSGSCYINVPF